MLFLQSLNYAHIAQWLCWIISNFSETLLRHTEASGADFHLSSLRSLRTTASPVLFRKIKFHFIFPPFYFLLRLADDEKQVYALRMLLPPQKKREKKKKQKYSEWASFTAKLVNVTQPAASHVRLSVVLQGLVVFFFPPLITNHVPTCLTKLLARWRTAHVRVLPLRLRSERPAICSDAAFCVEMAWSFLYEQRLWPLLHKGSSVWGRY